jgi:hypothetical protein
MKLPEIFKSILWSYDFEKVDPEKMRKTLVSQSINYGSLKHWAWLQNFYGSERLKEIYSSLPQISIRESARKLALIILIRK